jgi:hypothetical protein
MMFLVTEFRTQNSEFRMGYYAGNQTKLYKKIFIDA